MKYHKGVYQTFKCAHVNPTEGTLYRTDHHMFNVATKGDSGQFVRFYLRKFWRNRRIIHGTFQYLYVDNTINNNIIYMFVSWPKFICWARTAPEERSCSLSERELIKCDLMDELSAGKKKLCTVPFQVVQTTYTSNEIFTTSRGKDSSHTVNM